MTPLAAPGGGPPSTARRRAGVDLGDAPAGGGRRVSAVGGGGGTSAATAGDRAPVADGPAPAVADGRRLRRERNRQAVVVALLDLYREGVLRPSSAEVAQRAGLSPRSLFRYFDDVDDLCRAAIARHIERILPLTRIDADPGQPLAQKARALAAQRVRLFTAIGSVGVVSRLQAPFNDVIQAELTTARRRWRRQLAHLFEPELDALGPRADTVLAAADALCSFESFMLLRHDQGLSAARVRSALADGVAALLAPAGAASEGIDR